MAATRGATVVWILGMALAAALAGCAGPPPDEAEPIPADSVKLRQDCLDLGGQWEGRDGVCNLPSLTRQQCRASGGIWEGRDAKCRILSQKDLNAK